MSTNVHAEAPADGWIAFVSYRDVNWNIYLMDAEGNNQIRVTDLPGEERYPSWSPDGRRIVFSSHLHRDGQSLTDIYVMDANGMNLRKLTSGISPSWSPDGRRIAFTSSRNRGESLADVYVMDDDGMNFRRLTDRPTSNGMPAWSPDGQKIAFSST